MKTKHVILILIGVIVLAVAYYLISPLFINVRVDEASPEGASSPEIATDSGDGTEEIMSSEDVSTKPMQIEGTPGHPASGTARIVTADGKSYLRYENFKTINGPDIFIYLSKDIEATEFVNLGRVRATEGNINYEIPQEVDPRDYPYALVWCRAFSELFNSAKLY